MTGRRSTPLWPVAMVAVALDSSGGSVAEQIGELLGVRRSGCDAVAGQPPPRNGRSSSWYSVEKSCTSPWRRR